MIVEFALVFPLIIVPLLFGIIQYGYNYWALETAAATAREGARALSVGTDPTCTEALAKAHSAGPALGPVTVVRSPANPTAGQIVKVTVSFDSLNLKFLPVPNHGHITQTAQATVQTARAGTSTDPYLPC